MTELTTYAGGKAALANSLMLIHHGFIAYAFAIGNLTLTERSELADTHGCAPSRVDAVIREAIHSSLRDLSISREEIQS